MQILIDNIYVISNQAVFRRHPALQTLPPML